MFSILQKVNCFNMKKVYKDTTTSISTMKTILKPNILAIVKMKTTTSLMCFCAHSWHLVETLSSYNETGAERERDRKSPSKYKAEGKTIWRFHYHVNISSLWLFHYAHFTSNITDDRCSVFFQYPM